MCEIKRQIMDPQSSTATSTTFKKFRSPQTVIGRFVFRRTVRSATFVALAFGAIVAAKGDGYAVDYPTLASRAKLAATFSNEVGLRAIFGVPNHIATVTGFTVWNAAGPMMIIGIVWAFLVATKAFRGEENAGRWEMLVSGQTTARRAAINVLSGLGLSLGVLYAVASLMFIAIGKIHAVDFSSRAALFFGLSAISGVAIFICVGATASQLMPTRSRASSLSAAVFGVFFLLRAVADTTSAHWLLNFTPLGWIEKMQPLYGSNPVWLIPVVLLILVLVGSTIYLAGRRDLGASTFADKDSAKARTKLLNSPLPLAIRLTRSISASWLLAVTVFSLFFGLLAKAASSALSDSKGLKNEFGKITHASQSFGAVAFLGFMFLIIIILVMCYASSAVGAVREDEAEGYLDNLVVGPVSRLQWIFGRLLLIIVVTCMAAMLAVIGSWIGSSSQHAGIAFHTLLLAGANTIAPAVFIIGLGVLSLGIIPRLTTVITYGFIAWSFLLIMVGTGLNFSHWILDTSILQHVSLSPAVSPNWNSNLILIGLGVIMCLIGTIFFNRRDLASE